MAGKKSKSKSAAARGKAISEKKSSPLGLLQDLLSTIPEDVQLELLSSLMNGPPDDLLSLPRPKPRTKAQREIDRLLQEARDKVNPSEALPVLLKAEELARQAIGKRLEKLIGRMGDDPAGETLLEVQCDLSQALAACGRRAEALALAEETYRLDLDDPLDARLLVLAGYFDAGRLDDAQRLLDDACPEPWAAWNFGRVLLAVRRGQRSAALDNLLQSAHHHNPYVVSLLLNVRMPDPLAPGAIDDGEDSEAQDYAVHFLPAWKDSPGAIAWLRDAAKRLDLDIFPPDDDQPPPRPLTAREFTALPPHVYSTWIVGLHELETEHLQVAGQPLDRWITFAVSSDNDLIGFDFAASRPAAPAFWESLVEFMQDERQPGRPAKLLVFPAALAPQLKKLAAKAKIEVEPLPNPERLDALLKLLADRMQGGAAASQSLPQGAIQSAPLDVDEVWEAAVVHLQRQLNVGGHSLRPWVALVMSRSSGVVLWHELFTDSPPEGALANAVRMAIARPAVGPSRRPRQVIVRDADEALSLRELSDDAGFECLADQELPRIADAVASITEELLGGEPDVVLTKSAGATTADLERYYTAAAAFFRATPWKRFAMDELIGLEVDGPRPCRRYGLVMGQSGITLGLAIYQRLQDIETMFADCSERQAFDSYSVMFGEIESIAPADLDAIEQFGWPVATPEAYPDFLRIYPGPRVETPTAEELRFITAALESIAWLTQHADQKSTIVTIGDVKLTATRLGFVGAIDG